MESNKPNVLGELSSPGYYCRFSPEKKYKSVLFGSGLPSQASEVNDLQAIQNHELAIFAGALFNDGDIIAGGQIEFIEADEEDKNDGDGAGKDDDGKIVDDGGGEGCWSCPETKFFAQGFMHEINEKQFDIESHETVNIGIVITTKIVSWQKDPDLVDPAVGTQNYGEPGAERLQMLSEWVKESDLNADDPDANKREFYPIHIFVDGLYKPPVTQESGISSTRHLVARYDEAANGSYVASGMRVQFEKDDLEHEDHVCFIDEGLAHVEGYEVNYEYTKRFRVPMATQTRKVNNESQVSTGDGMYSTRWGPIARVLEIDGIREVTMEVERGPATSGADILMPRPVNRILRIWQTAAQNGSADIEFVQGTDYQHPANTDMVDWLIGGLQPNPRSVYMIQYWYNAQVEPVNFVPGSTQLDIRGFAQGTDFRIDYEFFLPRCDRVTLLKTGDVKVLQGVPDLLEPTPPSNVSGLSVSVVYVEYGKEPIIDVEYFRSFKMSDVQAMFSRMADIQFNIAQLMLKEETRSQDPATTKKNIFVDPFHNEDKFDHGLENTCQAFDGVLLPGVELQAVALRGDDEIQLPFTEELSTQQDRYCWWIRVNRVAWQGRGRRISLGLKPSRFTWAGKSDFQRLFRGWMSRKTKASNIKGWDWLKDERKKRMDAVPGKTTEVMPQISIRVNAGIFDENEDVEIRFDEEVIQTVSSAPNNEVDTTFTIPPNTLAGAKQVYVIGKTTGRAESVPFVGVPLNYKIEKKIPRRRGKVLGDPVAQTFEVEEDQYISSVDLRWFRAPALYQDIFITECQVGFPDRNKTIAATRKSADEIVEISYNSRANYHFLSWRHKTGWGDPKNWGWSGGGRICPITERAIQWPALLFTGNEQPLTPVFSTVGLKQLTMYFWVRGFGLEGDNNLIVEWYDGSKWQQISYMDGVWLNEYPRARWVQIPQEWCGKTNNRVRFRLNGKQLDSSDEVAIMRTWVIGYDETIPEPDSWTTVDFPKPVFLKKDTQYALVIESFDTKAHIWVGYKGWKDQNGKWMTEPPYKKGCYLWSSNGETWNPVQHGDLAFKLKKAKYENKSDVSLGVINVSKITDVIFSTHVDQFPDTELEFTARLMDRLIGGEPDEFVVNIDDPLCIEEYTGRIEFVAKMSTTNTNLTPVVDGDTQLQVGVVKFPSQYITRSWEMDGGQITANLYQMLPDVTTSIEMFYQDFCGTAAQDEGTPIGNANGNGALIAAYDGNPDKAMDACAAMIDNRRCYIGKDWGKGVEYCVSGFKITGSNDGGFRGTGETVPIIATLMGSDTDDPLTAHELDSMALANVNGLVMLNEYKVLTEGNFRYHWVKLEDEDGASDDKSWYIAQVVFFVHKWERMNPKPNPKPIGDGWKDTEYNAVFKTISNPKLRKETRIKIVQNSSDDAERPAARNLRVYVHDV
jgi:hypothetical protein